MGAVFLAADDTSHRVAALKVIAYEGPPDPAARRRFDREIEAVAAIRHRNVVRLLRSGVASGVPYALFERVRGRGLTKIGPLPWMVVVDLGRQLAAAIAAVHAAGWLHRDIKPSNVMVGDQGFVTLIDFGCAKRQKSADDPAGTTSEPESPLTIHGTVVGTREYLAPEMLAGDPATPASDVFSLGLVLHQLLDQPLHAPALLTALIERCQDGDPGRRPAAATLAGILADMPATAGMFHGHPLDDTPTWPVDADQRPTVDDRRCADARPARVLRARGRYATCSVH